MEIDIKCPICGTQNNRDYRFCKTCGATLVSDNLTHFTGRHQRLFNPKRLFVIISLLALSLIIIGIILGYTRSDLSDTKILLAETKNILTFTQDQLSVTQNILSSTQDELMATYEKVVVLQNELVALKGGSVTVSNLEIESAKSSLETFLSYAIQKNNKAMWEMINPDSKAMFKDIYDYEQRNGITSYQIFYDLSEYNIEATKNLSTWKEYSDVVACKVALTYNMHPLAGLLEGFFLGFSIAPQKQTVTQTLYLIKISNENWTVFYPPNN
jgi:hypothetical protein